MIRRFFFLTQLSIFICLSPLSLAANVTFFGTNSGYAGKTLEFFTYSERIFDSYLAVSSTRVDSSGAFTLSFPLDATKCIYCQTPLYTAYIFAEPGKSYQIELPPSTGENEINDNNPYFIKPLWHILPVPNGISNYPELNTAIYSFNNQFDPFLDKLLLVYYDKQQNKAMLDSFMVVVANLPSPENQDYFQSYILYKMAVLGFMDKQFNYADLYEKYLKDQPVLTDVPSWWEFFNLYYDGYFSSLATKKGFNELFSLIMEGKYYALNQLLKKDPALQDNRIREWAILKEIHKAYYNEGLALNTLLSLCDSLITDSSDKLSVSIAENVKKEASSLTVGNNPPPGKLVNCEGDTLEISSLKGKYSYIGFCSIDNIGCQKEFEYLKYFYHKHGKFLDIVIILPDSERERSTSFIEENQIPWKFWYSLEFNKLCKEYKVKAYPVFYLTDRNGKLIMSPAILPSAGFEQRLFNILKGRGEI